MEERDANQLEILAKIHNQLVDIKQILVEIELAKPGTSHTLQTRLRQFTGNDQHVNAEGHEGVQTARQQKVIAPTNESIQAGEAKEPTTGDRL